ncbi:hypothetical protein CIB84_016122 [Bambusicola thoracicus]|uniref:Uncharacterized protein n=1 Tax=Bambusicola thoracicus TaxID=9083 RepID=A0A2P4S7P5_BAMTH|nr:hypothetical protein CIB84_016122 [Bambusicola thoracicus]
MLWISSSVKSPTSSSSPAQNPTSGNLGLSWLVPLCFLGVLSLLWCPMCRSSGPC